MTGYDLDKELDAVMEEAAQAMRSTFREWMAAKQRHGTELTCRQMAFAISKAAVSYGTLLLFQAQEMPVEKAAAAIGEHLQRMHEIIAEHKKP